MVNEDLDAQVMDAIRSRNDVALHALPAGILEGRSSEIRNWICVAAAARDLCINWMAYVPAYRSQALTGVGLCFAAWTQRGQTRHRQPAKQN